MLTMELTKRQDKCVAGDDCPPGPAVQKDCAGTPNSRISCRLTNSFDENEGWLEELQFHDGGGWFNQN